MSVINMLANDIWSEADIVAHGRAVINSKVSIERQDELRTIMLGHLAGMRTATADEMAEVAIVQHATEQQVIDNAAARADMALLHEVLAYEAAESRLALPPVLEPTTITTVDELGIGHTTANPAIEQDAAERLAAQAVVDAATPQALAVYALRHPVEIPKETLL